MTWFAVYQLSDAALVSTGTSVASDADLAAEGLAKLTLAFSPQDPTKRWNPATLTFDTVVPPKASIRRMEFIDRFTPTEREEIFDSQYNWPNLSQRKRLVAFIEYIRLSDGVRTDDDYIMSEVNALESVGLIAPGRAAEVLA